MTNEQLLERITFLEQQAKSYTVDENTVSRQVDELQTIFAKQEEIARQISELEAKLNDKEKNYVAHSYFQEEGRLFDVEEGLEKSKVEIAANQSEITRIEAKLSEIASEVDQANAYLAELNQTIADERRNIRRAKASEDTTEFEDKIKDAYNTIDEYIPAYLEILSQERADLLQQLERCQQSIPKLKDKEERYQKLFDDLTVTLQKDTTLDQVKLNKDQQRLYELQGLQSAVNGRENYLSYNFSNELTALKMDLIEGRMTKAGLLAKIREMQNNYPFLEVDNEKLMQEKQTELGRNRELQGVYQARIDLLRSKLDDDTNYIPAIFNAEEINQDIMEYSGAIDDLDAQTSKINVSIQEHKADNKTIDHRIAKENERIHDLNIRYIRLQDQSRTLTLTKKEQKELERKIQQTLKEVQEREKRVGLLQKEKLSNNQLISDLQMRNKEIESTRKSYLRTLDSKKAELADHSTISQYDKNLDEMSLQELQEGLVALQAREKFLAFDFGKELASFAQDLKIDVEKQEDDKNILIPANHEPEPSTSISIIPAAPSPLEEDLGITGRIKGFHKAAKELIQKGKDFYKRNKNSIKAGILAISLALGVSCSSKRVSENEETYQLDSLLTQPTVATDLVNMDDVKDSTIDYKDFMIDKTVKRPIPKPTVEEPEISVENKETTTAPQVAETLVEPTPVIQPTQPVETKVEQPVVKEEISVAPSIEIEPTEPLEEPIITTGPSYTIDGDEEFIKQPDVPVESISPVVSNEPETFIPPVTEEESVTEELPLEPAESEIEVQEGKTYIVNTPQGIVAVDNSSGDNNDILPEDTSLDYSRNDSIQEVHYDDTDSSIDVTVDNSSISSEEKAIQPDENEQQMTDDYWAMLEELGYTQETDGRSR